MESGHCSLPETESISLSMGLVCASDKSQVHLVRLRHSERNSSEEEHVLINWEERYRWEEQVRFAPEEHNSQEGRVCFDQQEGKSQDEEVRFAPEGGNSHNDPVRFAPKGRNSCADQVRFAPVRLAPLHLAPLHLAPLHLAPLHLAPLHLAPAGGNSHDEQVRFAPEGGKPVEHFGELDLGLVQSLRDPTGLGRWGVVTDRPA